VHSKKPVSRGDDLFRALAENPADDELRQVYGDWLEENDRTDDAELLRLDRERPTTEAIAKLAQNVDADWREKLLDPPIEGCRREGCPNSWARCALKADSTRTCRACDEPVAYAKTLASAQSLFLLDRRFVVDRAVARRERDLQAVLAVRPQEQLPPEPTRPLITLPFFAQPTPPRTIGEVTTSLHLVAPFAMGQIGYLDVPTASNSILRLSFRYHWNRFDGDTAARAYAQLAHVRYRSVEITFARDAELIARWLRTIHGPPRTAHHRNTEYRVYGNYVFQGHDAQRCTLEWHPELPDWALAPVNSADTRELLAQLAKLLRKRPQFARIDTFLAHIPTNAGIVRGDAIGQERALLRFRPSISAVVVTEALGIPPRRLRPGNPVLGGWELDIALEGDLARSIHIYKAESR
jgi:uncharacterized protein (TIGR02996 family)